MEINETEADWILGWLADSVGERWACAWAEAEDAEVGMALTRRLLDTAPHDPAHDDIRSALDDVPEFRARLQAALAKPR